MATNYTPYMRPTEIALLDRFVPEKGVCLEFGSGGSTQFFLDRGIAKLYSVESDKSWLDKLRDNPTVQISHKRGDWIPLYADIGKVKAWGVPANSSPSVAWLNYHQHIWKKIPDPTFDFILVDGRFRVACLLQCLLRCVNREVIIVVHDFWNRPYYHRVLGHLNVVDKVDSLGVFTPKKRLNWKKLTLTLQDCQLDWR